MGSITVAVAPVAVTAVAVPVVTVAVARVAFPTTAMVAVAVPAIAVPRLPVRRHRAQSALRARWVENSHQFRTGSLQKCATVRTRVL